MTNEPTPFDLIPAHKLEDGYYKVFERLMKTVPEELKQDLTIANQKHISGKLDEAKALYEQISIRAPDSAMVLFSWGTLLCNMGEHALGVQVLKRSLDLFPENSEAWNNLGTAFKSEHQDLSSAECLEKSLEIDPKNGGTWANLAGCYVNNGMPWKVVEASAEALKYVPESPQANNHMALGLLESCRYAEAWPHWEYRRNLPDWKGNARDFTGLTRFDGTPIGPDARIWICGEQGVGDEILFAQCIRDGIRRGHYREDQLVIEFNFQVCEAMKRSFPQANVYYDHRLMRASEKKLTHYIESGSLMQFYRVNPEDFDGSPFVVLNPEHVARWRRHLESLGPGPYVGLTWQGGVKKTSMHLRAVPVEMLEPILSRPATFVSVQYGPHATEAAATGIPHWTQQAYNLDDRYHLIGALDLMITVCQTGFHMAGSIGKEVWCLVPSRPAWRYAGEGEESVWYDSAVLLRQKEDNWKELIYRAGHRLDAWLKERASGVVK